MTTILLSVHQKGNRRLLREWLSSQFIVFEADSPDAFGQPFDLCIVDAVALDQYEEHIRANKESQSPLFTPVLLIVQRKDVGFTTRNLWQTVDELIISPIEKIELQARVHNLVLTRQLSLTLKQRDEELLRHSEERYRTLVENIPGVVYIADLRADNETIFISPQVERLLGFPYSTWQADPKFWLKQIHPEDRERVLAANERCRVTGQPFHEEYRLIDSTGRIVWVDDTATVLPDEKGKPRWLQGTWLDITASKQAEQALRAQAHFLWAITETLPAIIYVYDLENQSNVYSNNGIEKILGYTPQDIQIMGSALFAQLIHPQDLPNVIEFKNKILQASDEDILEIEYRMKDKSGKWHTLRSYERPFLRNVHGKVQQTIGVAIDVTERKRIEEELRLSHDRLAELSRRLVEVHERESRAIARELHDQIGQMLTALKLNLAIAPQLPPEAAQKKYAQAEALVDELIQHIRNLSLELRPPMLDDLGLLPTLLWHTHHYQEQTGIAVEFHHQNIESKRFPAEVETTAYRIIQEALTNVARHAQATRARLEVRAEANGLEIRIEDNGIGFNPKDGQKKYQSAGLSSMRERARLIGGVFHIQSEPGKGTVLSIHLPLKENQA